MGGFPFVRCEELEPRPSEQELYVLLHGTTFGLNGHVT